MSVALADVDDDVVDNRKDNTGHNQCQEDAGG
jgi:hypothetical protein